MSRRLKNLFPIAPQLRYFAKQSGIENAELSELLGVPPHTFRNWLAGRTAPHTSDIASICRTLGIAPNVLFRPLELVEGIA